MFLCPPPFSHAVCNFLSAPPSGRSKIIHQHRTTFEIPRKTCGGRPLSSSVVSMQQCASAYWLIPEATADTTAVFLEKGQSLQTHKVLRGVGGWVQIETFRLRCTPVILQTGIFRLTGGSTATRGRGNQARKKCSGVVCYAQSN